MEFRGSFVPLVTPFDRKGRVDSHALERLIEWHIEEGSDGIIVCATTGEGPTLSALEKKKITQIALQAASGHIPILLSTGTNDTRESVRNTAAALKLGAQGCLVVTPYYNKPSQEGCIAHFTEISKVGLPMILYHNPPRAAVRLEAKTIRMLSENPTIVAIKESSHDLQLIRSIISDIAVFSGDDDLCFEIMQMGGVGSIATTANLVPKGWRAMIHDCLQGNWETAYQSAQTYLPLSRAIFSETNPQGVKYALSLLGKCQSVLRLPMLEPVLATKQDIEQQLLSL
ncbi:MAG: dihydrodipicolinate synthase [uncultured bacterium]|nr:MAG: dihydrodipicolinate synthase [uncultured bacterium]OGN55464.1 MAG: 4-hydroxy-tetrahydrodipicolinate synthase [Chlamydiae bacterium RIFCSPHIGHO2_01_FULL_44_39]OGN58465.1 MAG: 4-hydroxy-tetrahydrodipicolinate synthase [Chlamydiae bacterium RIFCSPHIGHO2_02_FULL_45_9]OGN59967.1 MAG: 4-hydroxy-tetrahydrodipicolinate synthase [Chlamydiae bacterium RIFCSPHIGHO2_12_FULL_44_59]OGN66182.1 MAG: 4-hydroxy-tetrahydrodipicolinate synthase [Chlamydiae bacterium RIFCSPLOWO2_01_FULL_44_52]OGN69086.1 MA